MDSFLGIDIGTTSVKVCQVTSEEKVINQQSCAHNGTIEPSVPQRHEHDPRKLLSTALELLKSFDVSRTKSVAVSGQMHGVVLWNSDSMHREPNEWVCSNLITWMDQRCDSSFLSKLPDWNNKDNEREANLATGFGGATLAWLKQHEALDSRWDRAGTIMDLLVTVLTGIDGLISCQNAYSWGYFSNGAWNFAGADQVFPVHLFPKPVADGTVVGNTREGFRLPAGVPVFVALGDLQASLLPVLVDGEAVIHLGTAPQMVFQVNQKPSLLIKDCPAVTCLPYFNDKKIMVAASLNGGNAFDIFVEQILRWAEQISGAAKLQADKGKVDALLNTLSSSSQQLKVLPLFYGERHAPTAGATVAQWTANTTLPDFLQAIARGIIQNLSAMMPNELLTQCGIKKIRLLNRARNEVFVEEAQRCFPSCAIVADGDIEVSSAYGTALFARRQKK